MRVSLAVWLVALSAAGCFRAQAKTPPPLADLLTPAPPERLIVPVKIEEPEPPPPPPAAAASPTPPPRTPAARPAEPRAPATPPTAAPPSAAEPPAPPPVLLQTTSNPQDVARRARELIDLARRDLGFINVAALSANARAQYDTAKGFIAQSEKALEVRNVVLARELADKAASLASQLRR